MVGIEKTATFHITCGVAEIFVGHALVACKVEALLNSVRIQPQHFFHTQRHLVRTKLMLQPSFFGEKRVRTISRNHDRSIQLTILTSTAYANDPLLFI